MLRVQQTLTIFLILLTLNLSAQEEQIGNWLMYFGSNKISDKVSIHSEVQYRHHTIAPVNVEQLLLRTGINCHIADNAILTIGYGYVAGHQYESEQATPESEESRIWQQFILTNKISRVKFEHRYRLEQRWVNGDYKNRFRYRLMLFIPINKPVIEKGTLFIGIYDEVFINDKKTFFDRNRLYGALGYQLSKTTSFQAGVMQQQVNNSNKFHLQFAVAYNPDLRKKK